jgi:hypothetical protein
MSEGNAVIEPLLRRVRYSKTIRAVQAFDAAGDGQTATDGQEFFNMRSAMDIRPTAGKEMSRKGVRNPRGSVPTEDQARTSTFVDFDEVDACVQGLRSNGVYVFSSRLPQDMVERMRASALAVPAMARGLEEPAAPYPRTSPRVGRYDIDEDNTMASPDMQDYCSDPALALIAARYLEQPVIQDQTALWWTTTQGAENAAANAWLFHQDRDRLSFLKFFCYLTDVGADNGPHTVVQGTHQRVPKALATDGRKDDDVVRSTGLWDKVIELTGPAGTLMAVDTAGLHKGQPPVSGDRCVLQVEFATSLFGAPVDYPVFIPSELAAERYQAMPQILQRWRQAFDSNGG